MGNPDAFVPHCMLFRSASLLGTHPAGHENSPAEMDDAQLGGEQQVLRLHPPDKHVGLTPMSGRQPRSQVKVSQRTAAAPDTAASSKRRQRSEEGMLYPGRGL